MIYLHETLGLAPGRLSDYADRFVTGLVPVMERHGARPLGLWQTWRTSQLHALWEMDGQPSFDRLDAACREDPDLARYLARAQADQTSSKSTILRPTAFCPDLARIRTEGLKGSIYLLAVIPLAADKLREYLELFPKFGLAYEERYGLKTVGYWTGGGGEPYQSEAFTCTQLCAGGDWSWWARFSQQRGKDPEVQAWMQRALGYRTHHQTSYLVPLYLPY